MQHDFPAFSFTTARGNVAQVFNTREFDHNSPFPRAVWVASFAMVNGHRVECSAAFRAPTEVREAGF